MNRYKARCMSMLFLALAINGKQLQYSFSDPAADHLDQGLAAAENGKLDEAISSFRYDFLCSGTCVIFVLNRAAARFSDSTEAWFNLGVALLDKANEIGEAVLQEEAVACYRTAIERDSENQQAIEELRALGEDIRARTIICEDDHMQLRRNTMQDFMHCNDAALFGACDKIPVPGAQHPDDLFDAKKECPVSCGLCGGHSPMTRVL